MFAFLQQNHVRGDYYLWLAQVLLNYLGHWHEECLRVFIFEI